MWMLLAIAAAASIAFGLIAVGLAIWRDVPSANDPSADLTKIDMADCAPPGLAAGIPLGAPGAMGRSGMVADLADRIHVLDYGREHAEPDRYPPDRTCGRSAREARPSG
jgi:hypothetical protein